MWPEERPKVWQGLRWACFPAGRPPKNSRPEPLWAPSRLRTHRPTGLPAPPVPCLYSAGVRAPNCSGLARLDLLAGRRLCSRSPWRLDAAARQAPRCSSGVLEESQVPYSLDEQASWQQSAGVRQALRFAVLSPELQHSSDEQEAPHYLASGEQVEQLYSESGAPEEL